jgi:hypothetical protein
MGEQPNSTPQDNGLLNGENNEANDSDGKIALKNVLESNDVVTTPDDVEPMPTIELSDKTLTDSNESCEKNDATATSTELLESVKPNPLTIQENELPMKHSGDSAVVLTDNNESCGKNDAPATSTELLESVKPNPLTIQENELPMKHSEDSAEVLREDDTHESINKESNIPKSPQAQENGLSDKSLESTSDLAKEPATEFQNGHFPKISIVPELAKLMPTFASISTIQQDNNGSVSDCENTEASSDYPAVDETVRDVPLTDSVKQHDEIKQDLRDEETVPQPKVCGELENDFVSVEPQMANLEHDVMAASFNNDPFADITDNHLCENVDDTMSSMASDSHKKIDENVVHSLSDTDDESDEERSDLSSEENEDELANSDVGDNLSSSSVSIVEDKNEPIALSDDSSVDEETSNGKRNRNGEDASTEPTVKKAKTMDSEIEEISSDEDVILIEDCTTKKSPQKSSQNHIRLAAPKRRSLRDSLTSSSSTSSSASSTPSDSDDDDVQFISSKSVMNKKSKNNKYKKKAKNRRRPEHSPKLNTHLNRSKDQLNRKSSSLTPSTQDTYATLRTTITRIPVETPTKVLPHIPAISRVPLLPELTDDMFVREVPSSIVPYVYEKPSSVNLREAVVKMKALLDEHEQTLVDSVKCEETPVESVTPEADTDVKAEVVEKKKPARRRRNNQDSDDSDWGAENNVESESEETSDSDDGMRVPRIDFEDDIESIKTHIITPASATAAQTVPKRNDSYFESPLGKFFVEIGNDLVDEYVQTEFIRLQKRSQSGKNKPPNPDAQAAIDVLIKNLELSEDHNKSSKFPLKKCEFCPFETESLLIMAYHYEKPHFGDSTFKCNFCEFNTQPAYEILQHLDEVHQIKGRIETLPANPCPNCTFEDSGKAGKLTRHLVSCMKKFKAEVNLAPNDWEPPAKNSNSKCGLMGIVNSYQAAQRQTSSVAMNELTTINHKVSRTLNSSYQPLSVGTNSSVPKTSPPSIVSHNRGLHSSEKPSFVICEICDGYIKDAELRNHMQVTHKVKVGWKLFHTHLQDDPYPILFSIRFIRK